MEMHAQRAKSATAKLLVKAMKELGPKFASKPKTEKLAGGLYGMPTKTARLGLQACSDLRAYVVELAFGLHMRRQARDDRITGFMKEHAKTARCGYTRMLLGCYPDAPKTAKKKLPEALKKNQFTSENNPNPKGSDADGDGKTNEKKPFDSKKKAQFDPDQVGDLIPPAEHEADEPYMVIFVQDEFDELSDMQEGDQFPPADTKLAAELEEANLAADLEKWAAHFDPHHISKTEKGPLEHDSDEAPFMGGQFTEQETNELSDKQEAGQLPHADKNASFGFAHRPLMEAKRLIEEGDKRGAEKKLEEASKLISQLSSSKSLRARDFADELKARIMKMASVPPPSNSVEGWIEWQE